MSEFASEPTVQQTGEFGLIDLIQAEIGPNPQVVIGPGDDAAALRVPTGQILVSTDILVEGQHFRRHWASAEQIGRRAAAANLSDLNAMGGVATALTVGLAAPPELPTQWALDLARGLALECSLVGATIAGGDLSAADSIFLGVTAIGEAAHPVTRSGARPGDTVALAGRLGWSAAGLAALSRGFRSPRSVVEAHLVPSPPYAAGPAAAAAGATAMIDVSDGLVADTAHIAQASGVSIDIDPQALEIADPIETVAAALGQDAVALVLSGGEDFALVATFGPGSELPDGWVPIGTVLEPDDELLVLVGGQEYLGTPGSRHWST